MPNYTNTRLHPTTGNVERNRQEQGGGLPGNVRKQEAPARRPVGPQKTDLDARTRAVNPKNPG